MPGQPTIAVVYDKGAVSAGDVAVGLRDVGRAAFVVPRSEHVEMLRPVLDELGEVLPLTGDRSVDASALRRLSASAIVTFSEPMLRVTADLAAATGLAFHDVDTARLLTDKARQRRRLREAGIDDVRCCPLHRPEDWPDAVAAVGLPAIIKPVRGEGSRHTYAVADADGAARLLPQVFAAARTDDGSDGPAFVVEELLRGMPGLPFGDYVSVESLCEPDAVTHLALTGKFPLVAPFREPGQFWPALVSAVDRDAIFDLTSRALRALGVTLGLTHTEIKLTASGPRIIEVNGRIGGHVNELAKSACGVDLPRLAALQALGEPVEVGEMCPATVHFQHHGLAPTRPCELMSIDGARRCVGCLGSAATAPSSGWASTSPGAS